jgi:hypothetical protein
MAPGEVRRLKLLGQRRGGGGIDPLEDAGPRQNLVHVAFLS